MQVEHSHKRYPHTQLYLQMDLIFGSTLLMTRTNAMKFLHASKHVVKYENVQVQYCSSLFVSEAKVEPLHPDEAMSRLYDLTILIKDALNDLHSNCLEVLFTRIHQAKLGKSSHVEQVLSGEELARELLTALSTELGIGGIHLVAAMHDRAPVNGAAMRTLLIL